MGCIACPAMEPHRGGRIRLREADQTLKRPDVKTIRRQNDQTWKLSPQPQRPFSFGLVKVNPEVNLSSV